MYSVIYGRITFDINDTGVEKIFKNLRDDSLFPWFESGMFGFGHSEKSWGEKVVSFAATYKYNPDETNKLFILRIESILKDISFLNALFHCDLGLGDSIDLLWISKGSIHNYIISKYNMIEMPEWYFSIRNLGVWNDVENLKRINLFYPKLVDSDFERSICTLLNSAPKDVAIKLPATILNHRDCYTFLLSRFLEKEIIFDISIGSATKLIEVLTPKYNMSLL